MKTDLLFQFNRNTWVKFRPHCTQENVSYKLQIKTRISSQLSSMLLCRRTDCKQAKMVHCSCQSAPVSNFVCSQSYAPKQMTATTEMSLEAVNSEMPSELSFLGISSFWFNQRKSIFVKKLHVPNKNAVRLGNENMKQLFVTSVVNHL